jgi:hypothetical protein
VIVQGAEAGGHVGEVATTVLLPQVVDAVDIPVVAAGGFFDAAARRGAGLRRRGHRDGDALPPDERLAGAGGDQELYSTRRSRARRHDAGRRLGAPRCARPSSKLLATGAAGDSAARSNAVRFRACRARAGAT